MRTKRTRYLCNWLVALVLLAGIQGGTALAEENHAAWNGSALVEMTGTNPYKTVFLNEHIYGHALPSLADLRLVDCDGRDVPYYIQNGYDAGQFREISYRCAVKSVIKQDGDTMMDFQVIPQQENTDIVGNKLIFNIQPQHSLKHLEVYGSYDQQTWEWVASDYVYRIGNLEKCEVALGGAKKFTAYRIKLLNNAENISLTNIQLVYGMHQYDRKTFINSIEPEYGLKNDGKVTTITISNQHCLKMRRIILDVDGNFQRRYELHDENHRLLKQGEISNLQFHDVQIANTAVNLNRSSATPNMTLTIFNRDDRPLSIRGLKVEYEVDQLVFQDVGDGPYRLLFDNPNAQKPAYELGLQRAYIEQEPHDLCSLGAIELKARPSEAASQLNWRAVFNGVVAVVSALLILLLVRRLARKQNG